MSFHISVLLHEVIDGLDFHDGDVFLDGTLGAGGHTLQAFKTGKNIKVIGFDMDEDALVRVRNRIDESASRLILVNDNFRNLDKALLENKIPAINKSLFDLGLSSHQIDESNRGFAFKTDEPLLMTMRKDTSLVPFTAYDIANAWDEENIADIIYAYGEERFSRRIAKAIVEARAVKVIETTGELAEIVKGAIPRVAQSTRIHPATKTFQAFRIAVNDELASVREGITKAYEYTLPQGRIAVISFHSLEDRIIKNLFRDWQTEGKGESLTKKPITPSEEEIEKNPRSRSAKLRIFIKK